MQIKRKYTDPYIVVSGDFNQRDVEAALSDYPDMRETHVSPTRGNRAIDRTFTNFADIVSGAGVLPPLESEDSTKKVIIWLPTSGQNCQGSRLMRY